MKRARFFAAAAAVVVGSLALAVCLAQAAPPVQSEFPIFVGQGGATSVDIDGSQVVWNKGMEIWHQDLTTGVSRIIHDDYLMRAAWDPRVSGSTVVWADYRNGDTDVDIWAAQLPSGGEYELFPEEPNANARSQTRPAISGDRVVWIDAWPDGGHGDIRGVHLSTGQEFWVVNDGDAQEEVAISGDTVVWSEYRWDGGERSIRGYDLATQTEFPICTVAGVQRAPDVSGDIVVWVDERNGESNPDIYGYDLSSGTEFPICTRPGSQVGPRISGGVVVYNDGSTDPSSLCGFDLATHTEFTVTTSIDGRADVSGDTVVWSKSGGQDLYGAHLAFWDASVAIDAGAAATADTDVQLALAVSRWSGVASGMRFSDDGISWSSWEPFAIAKPWVLPSGDGVKTVYAQFDDVAGGLSPEVSDEILLDTTPPVTTDDVTTLWSPVDVTVTLTSTDDGSGVASTSYMVNAPPWLTGTSLTVPALVDHSNDGVHAVSYQSVDSVGNTETAKSCQVGIDTLPPVSEATNLDTAWHPASFRLGLAATDQGSGVSAIRYSVDGGAEQTGASVAFETDGPHVVAFHAIDRVGNPEIGKTCTVYSDVTAPTTLCDAPIGWVAAPLTVHFDATDSLSGVDYSEYQVDGATWQRGTEAEISTGGTHELRYRSVDKVGNAEAPRSATVQVDTLPPTTVASGNAGWHNRPVSVTLTATDGGCGVAATYYSVDGAAWQTGNTASVPAPSDHSRDGLRTVRFYSTDLFGNVEPAKSCTVMIDTRGPVTRAPRSATARREGTARLYYRVNDALSDTADVTILVKSAAGRTVKTLELGEKSTGELLRCSFPCNLRTGSYRFLVRAVDLAGNRQSGTGSNTLRVLPPPSDPYLRIKSTASASLTGWTKVRKIRLFYGRMTGGGWRVHARNEGGSWGAWHSCGTAGSFSWMLPSGNGTKKVTLQYVKGSSTRSFTKSIKLDMKRPTIDFYTAAENSDGNLVGVVRATDNMSGYLAGATCTDVLGSWVSICGSWVASGGTARWVLLEPPIFDTYIMFVVRDRAGNARSAAGTYQ